MENNFKLFAVKVFCVMFILISNLIAQDVLLDEIPISDETLKLDQYPVHPDPILGVSTARLGEDRLYQLDATLVGIPPGGQLPPSRHLAEEMIYIISGEGYTSMWVRPGEKPQRYVWTAGDFLSPSLNAWHQHFNGSSEMPARYLSVTTGPLTQNLFHDQDVISSSEYVFEERWQMGITQRPEYKTPDDIDMLAGHFLPNLPDRRLQQRRQGVVGLTIRPDGDMAGNHLMQLLIREYHQAWSMPLDGARSAWERVYLVLEGEGSTILKRGDEPVRVVNWKKGDLFIVEANEYRANGTRIGSVPKPPYPRLMHVRASGYFLGIGNVGETDNTPIDNIIVK